MSILVTGATGFLGSWLTKRLCELNYNVRILRRESSDISEISTLDVEHCIGDVTDRDSLVRATKNVDRVYHLAGLIAYSKSMRPAMNKVNIEGTQNVVEACKLNSVGKVTYMSSVVAIGASFNENTILNEESSFNLKHLNLGYFETKRVAEEIIKESNNKGEIEAVILNPSTVYGPGDARKSSRKTQLKVARGKFPFYTKGGVNIVNIHDVVAATIKASEVAKPGERYILGGENITIKQLFEHIAECAGVEAPKVFLPTPLLKAIGATGSLMEKFGKKGPISYENALTATMYHWFDSTKAQRELGLQVTPAKESIEQSVNWVKNNNLI